VNYTERVGEKQPESDGIGPACHWSRLTPAVIFSQLVRGGVEKVTPSASKAKPAAEPRSKWRRILLVSCLIVVALIVWVAIDLYGPRTSHLRDTDPDEVARLETAMWRSYYEKQQVRLFNQLAELLRKQYNMPLVRSNRVAYQAAKAAFIFKDGKLRSDY